MTCMWRLRGGGGFSSLRPLHGVCWRWDLYRRVIKRSSMSRSLPCRIQIPSAIILMPCFRPDFIRISRLGPNVSRHPALDPAYGTYRRLDVSADHCKYRRPDRPGFAGTWVITILMSLAAAYLVAWEYDRLKPLLFRDREQKTRIFSY